LKSILVQLMTLQLFCALVALVVLWKLSDRTFTETMSKGFLTNAETVGASLSKEMELPVANRDFTAVQSALDSALKLPNVEWAYVTSAQGEVVADTFVPVIPAGLPKFGNSQSWVSTKIPGTTEPLMVFTEPIMGGIFGAIHIGFNQTNLLSSISQVKTIVLVTLGVMTFLMTSLIGLVTRRILAPIQRLTERSLEIANDLQADFEPLPIDSHNEIGSLTSSFNLMIVERQEHRRNLEDRVQARTQELLEANTALESAMAERKLMEGQLVQAQKLESIGQLAAGIAHEVNTPIQYIGDNCLFLKTSFVEMRALVDQHLELLDFVKKANLNAELAARMENNLAHLDTAFLIEEIPKAIDQSLEGVERVSQIVKAMKEFAHPGSGEKAPVNLNHAIRNTLMVCRNEVKHSANVITDLEPGLPLVHCLLGEFNQVILNLVVNAAHAMQGARKDGSLGTIKVSTRADGEFVEIRVQDNGTGIPAGIRDKIFDPFFTTKEVGKGSGQGLAIARNAIVKKHGGTLTFETEEGVGTTFIVRMPILARTGSESKDLAGVVLSSQQP
jgi:signal transduction histidine kinase